MPPRKKTGKAKGVGDEEETEKLEDDEVEDEEEDEEGDDEEGDDEEGDDEADAEDDGDGDDDAEDDGDGDDDDEDGPKRKKKAKPKAKKAPAKRTRSSKKAVRQKAVWVVLDNSSKELETFPFNQKAEAEQYLIAKSEDKKGLFLQMKKVNLEE